jgi:hypothetical protein
MARCATPDHENKRLGPYQPVAEAGRKLKHAPRGVSFSLRSTGANSTSARDVRPARGLNYGNFQERLRNPETQALRGFNFVAAVFRGFVASLENFRSSGRRLRADPVSKSFIFIVRGGGRRHGADCPRNRTHFTTGCYGLSLRFWWLKACVEVRKATIGLPELV